MRMLCLKALTHLVSYFSRALSDSMSDIMQAAWVSFTTSLQLYQVRGGNRRGCGAAASADRASHEANATTQRAPKSPMIMGKL